ncbi:uncharacterized protein LOC144095604 [Amblyomma americanum]
MNRMSAVVPAILPARNSSQARDPTHRPPFATLTSVLCCQRPASIGPCGLPAFGCVIPPDPFMLKTKSCMEVVQATKLRVIFARDLEQAGKLVDGQWYSLSKASFFSKTKTIFLGSWAMYLGTCGQGNAGQHASASLKKSTKQINDFKNLLDFVPPSVIGVIRHLRTNDLSSDDIWTTFKSYAEAFNIIRTDRRVVGLPPLPLDMPQDGGAEQAAPAAGHRQHHREPRTIAGRSDEDVDEWLTNYERSPGGNDAEVFRNRKGCFSINVQAITGPKLQFLDLVASWPGSAHDSRIFDNSRARVQYEQGDIPGILLGDMGYACRPYLMTPLRDDVLPGSPQYKYNKSQIRTRCSIERTFGVWKRRFPCLDMTLQIKTATVPIVITACAALHNLGRLLKDPVPPALLYDATRDCTAPVPVSRAAQPPATVPLVDSVFSELAGGC